MESFYYSFGGLNEAIVTLANKLLQYGIERKMNGFQASTASSCFELPRPLIVEIKDPTARQVVIPERKWNKILPMAESLWLLLGDNDLDELPGHFVKSIYNFSDDGHTWRGGYGPRMRAFTGVSDQYVSSRRMETEKSAPSFVSVDQLQYVVDLLTKEPTSRQALITIHDPGKDSLPGMFTKDIPCTRSLHFMIVEGKLNAYTYMRSNDFAFGFGAVNVYNFTLIQQYVAKLLGIPVGSYWHMVDNFHYYISSKEMVEMLAKTPLETAKMYDQSLHNDYEEKITDLQSLDTIAQEMFTIEERFWELNNEGADREKVVSVLESIEGLFKDPFFTGWTLAFPLAMKNIRKYTKEWIVEKGYNQNKMILHFFPEQFSC